VTVGVRVDQIQMGWAESRSILTAEDKQFELIAGVGELMGFRSRSRRNIAWVWFSNARGAMREDVSLTLTAQRIRFNSLLSFRPSSPALNPEHANAVDCSHAQLVIHMEDLSCICHFIWVLDRCPCTLRTTISDDSPYRASTPPTRPTTTTCPSRAPLY